jgi:hypothetical protein
MMRAATVVALFLLGLGFAGGYSLGRDQGYAVAWDSFECRDVTDPNEWVLWRQP